MKEALLELLAQNQVTNFQLNTVRQEDSQLRLNENANSIGFIMLHLAESLHLFGTFFGIKTSISNTTIGKQDTGQGLDIEKSKKLIQEGLDQLKALVDSSEENFWTESIDTPFFGNVSRFSLFAHILFHQSHHTGQITLTLSKGKN